MNNTIQQTGFILPQSIIANGLTTGNPWQNPNDLLLVDGDFAQADASSGSASDIIPGNYNFNLPQDAVVVGIEMKFIGYRGAQTDPVITLDVNAVDDTSGSNQYYPYTAPYEGLTPDNEAHILGSSTYLFGESSFTVDQINNMKFQLIANGAVWGDCFLVNVYYYIPSSPDPEPSELGCEQCNSPVQVQDSFFYTPFLSGETVFLLKPGSLVYANGQPFRPEDIGDCGGIMYLVFDEGKVKQAGSNFEEVARMVFDPEDSGSSTTITVLSGGVIQVDIKTVNNRGRLPYPPYTHDADFMSNHDANTKVIVSNPAEFEAQFVRRCQEDTVFSPPITVADEDEDVVTALHRMNFIGENVQAEPNALDPRQADVTVISNPTNVQATIENTSTGTTNTTPATSLTISHVITDANYLRVAIQTDDEVISSVTYNGDALTLVGSKTNGPADLKVALYDLINPDAGTHNVVITMASASNITSEVTGWLDADISDPIDGVSGGVIGSGTAPSDSLTTTSQNTVIQDVVGTVNNATTFAQGALWTIRGHVDSAARQGATSTRKVLLPATVTDTYTINPAGSWAILLAGVRGAVNTNTDTYQVKVKSNDTTPGFLNDKLMAGDNITFEIINDGANEKLKINSSGGSGGGSSFTDQSPDEGTYGALVGAIDGVNTTFTVSEGEYVSGTLIVALNGLVQFQSATGDWEETDPTTGTFDFIDPPQNGDIVTVMYETEQVVVDTNKVKVTNADTTPGYLDDKISFTSSDSSVDITESIINPGANEVKNIDLKAVGSGNTSLLTSNQYLPVASSSATDNFGASDTPRGDIMTDSGTSRIYVPMQSGTTLRFFKNTYGSFFQEKEVTITLADLTLTNVSSIDTVVWTKSNAYLYALVRYRRTTATSYTRVDVVRLDLDGTNKVATNIYAGPSSGGDGLDWAGSANNYGAAINGSSLFTIWRSGSSTNQMREYTISGTTYTLANTYTVPGIAIQDTKGMTYDSITQRFYLFGGNDGGNSNITEYQKMYISGSTFVNDGSPVEITGLSYMSTQKDSQYSLASVEGYTVGSFIVYTINLMSNVDGGASTNRNSFWLQGLTLPKA